MQPTKTIAFPSRSLTHSVTGGSERLSHSPSHSLVFITIFRSSHSHFKFSWFPHSLSLSLILIITFSQFSSSMFLHNLALIPPFPYSPPLCLSSSSPSSLILIPAFLFSHFLKLKSPCLPLLTAGLIAKASGEPRRKWDAKMNLTIEVLAPHARGKQHLTD